MGLERFKRPELSADRIEEALRSRRAYMREVLVKGVAPVVAGLGVLSMVLGFAATQIFGLPLPWAVAVAVAVLLAVVFEGGYRALHSLSEALEGQRSQLATVKDEIDGAKRPKPHPNLEFGAPHIVKGQAVDPKMINGMTYEPVKAEFVRIPVLNNPRNADERMPATGVHGRMSILGPDRTPLLGPFGMRWSSGDGATRTLEENRLPHDLDTVMRFSGPGKCFVWNDQSMATIDFDRLAAEFEIDEYEFFVVVEVQSNEGDHVSKRFPVSALFDGAGVQLKHYGEQLQAGGSV